MGLGLNEKNLTEAYCKALACTGIGAAVNHCDDLLTKVVLLVVPQDMHDDFPEKLQLCANKICTDESYGWRVDQIKPSVDSETTFKDIFDKWFSQIVWP